MRIRKPAVANQFYPGNIQILKHQVLEYLEKANPAEISGKIKAVISPHAGYIYSGPTAAYAYKILKKLDQTKIWKVLLLGPSHHIPFYGAASPEEEKWEMPFGQIDIKNVASEIKNPEEISEIPNANKDEHSLEVQVPFLQSVLKNFILYPLVLGNVRTDSLAEELADFAKQEDVIIVASSDLSHFLKYDEAKKSDLNTSEAIVNNDIQKMTDEGDACGIMGILTVMYLAKKFGWKCKMLNYMNSGDTAGDKSRVVGYGAYVFYE